MRELTLDEVELVHGGYDPGTDGPSGGFWNSLATAANLGTSLGTAGGVGIGVATGYKGLALVALGGQGAMWGNLYGLVGFGTYAAATYLGADRLGSAIGSELYSIRSTIHF